MRFNCFSTASQLKWRYYDEIKLLLSWNRWSWVKWTKSEWKVPSNDTLLWNSKFDCESILSIQSSFHTETLKRRSKLKNPVFRRKYLYLINNQCSTKIKQKFVTVNLTIDFKRWLSSNFPIFYNGSERGVNRGWN